MKGRVLIPTRETEDEKKKESKIVKTALDQNFQKTIMRGAVYVGFLILFTLIANYFFYGKVGSEILTNVFYWFFLGLASIVFAVNCIKDRDTIDSYKSAAMFFLPIIIAFYVLRFFCIPSTLPELREAWKVHKRQKEIVRVVNRNTVSAFYSGPLEKKIVLDSNLNSDLKKFGLVKLGQAVYYTANGRFWVGTKTDFRVGNEHLYNKSTYKGERLFSIFYRVEEGGNLLYAKSADGEKVTVHYHIE